MLQGVTFIQPTYQDDASVPWGTFEWPEALNESRAERHPGEEGCFWCCTLINRFSVVITTHQNHVEP